MQSTVESPCLHCHPPITPSAFYGARRSLLVGLGLAFALAAALAAWSRAGVLLTWDEPIQDWVQAQRSGALDTLFRSFSRLGSTYVVLTAGTILAVLAWRRCHAVAIAVVLAMLTRPGIEFALKEIVGRDRPDSDQLVNGVGHSFPSGHTLAAVALFGLVPVVVGLYTRRRGLWWAAAAVSAFAIVGISASRTYLGVHWFSDIVAGMLFGSFFLLAVERAYDLAHRYRPCSRQLTVAFRVAP